MAIKVGGITVINDSRGLENITSGLKAEVRQPEITFPADGSTGFDAIDAPNIKVTALYYHIYGLTKKGTEVQISVNSDFSSPIVDADEVGTDTTFNYDIATYTFATNTLYYARVRHYDVNDVYSDWSESVSFTTPSTFIFINQPTISSPTNNAIDQVGNPSIVSSAFATTPAGQDTHVSSDWQVATDSNFTTIVDSSTADTTNLTSYTVQTELAVATVHYVRVRYNGSSYTSEWSPTIAFTTLAQYTWLGMATISEVTSYGDSYTNFISAFTDSSGNKSVIVAAMPNSGANSSRIHRFSDEFVGQGKVTFDTNYSYHTGLAYYDTTNDIGAFAGFDGSNTPRVEFLDLRNGGIAPYSGHAGGLNRFTLGSGYWISSLTPTGTNFLIGVGYPSNYSVGHVFHFNHTGMAASKTFSLANQTNIFPISGLRLSDGKVAVVGEYRSAAGNGFIFLVIFTDVNFGTVYSSHLLTGSGATSNNTFMKPLANGNLLIGDWKIVMEVDVSTSTPSIVNYGWDRSTNRIDKAHETPSGIVYTNSQTSTVAGLLNRSDFSFNTSRYLAYSTTHEWFDSNYSSDEKAIYAAGRWYTGSAYQGFITKIPANVGSLDTAGTAFPNLPAWSWTTTTATQTSSVTPNVQAIAATLGNPNLSANAFSGTASAGSISGITVSQYE